LKYQGRGWIWIFVRVELDHTMARGRLFTRCIARY
jgi:hypothetical protein